MTRTIIASLLICFSFSAQAGEYIVKLKEGAAVPLSNFKTMNVKDTHEAGRLLKVDISESTEKATVTQLMATEGVEYVVENFQLKAFRKPPSTQALKEQWAITKVKAEEAWQLAGNKGGHQVKVAVIDTGVDYTHESLRTNMIQGYDFFENDNDPMDETSFQNPGHGTHCAGAVGANGLVDGGVIGVSPTVSIMPLRFLGPQGNGDLMAGIKAIDYAIEKGVNVISASWGATVSRSQAQPLIEAVERADKAGIVFVVAAANDGRSNDRTDVFPANANTPNMISVAASNISDSKPNWSNYGKHSVDVAAPGENILSTLPGNKYGDLSGTSMATPMVSGLVALLLAQEPDMTGREVRSLIQSSAAKVNIETACDCRIDAGSAVQNLLDKKMFVVPYAETLGTGETMQFSAKFAREPLSFVSTNASVAEISAAGLLTAKSQGETTVQVTDADGVTATSYKIYVGKSSGGGSPGNPGNPGNPDPGTCPIGDQALCDIVCQFQPDLPFCQQ